MDKERMHRKTVLLVSPYLFILSFSFAFMMLGAGFVFYKIISHEIKGMVFSSLLSNGWLLSISLLASAYVGLFLVYISQAYAFGGIVILYENYLELRAPFRRTIRINYTEIIDIGIDYAWLSVSKQFWFYISTVPIPRKYLHRITNLPFSRTTIRIQYSLKAYDALLHSTPTALKKKLKRLSSTVRLFKLDKH